MGKRIYLEPLKRAPGRSIFHYSQYDLNCSSRSLKKILTKVLFISVIMQSFANSSENPKQNPLVIISHGILSCANPSGK